ncbi:MAG: CvpA family protein [Planctomycetota bacterium]|nr:CvpA family protein [Planctomycetota bacterium]
MDLLPQLELLGWVDITALAVLLVFFVIGLFKGLIWQTSRIAILVVSYLVAGRYGQTLGEMIARKNAEPVAPGSGTGAGTGIAAPIDTPDTTIYLAYVLLFLGVLVILSLVAMIVQKLAAKAGLGFFDRLGGGVLGVATGGCLVLFGLFVVGMFFPTSTLAQAAKNSHSWRLSQRGISSLGSVVPDELRTVLKLEPLEAPGPGDGTKGRAVGQPGQPPTPGQVPDPTKPRR